MSAPCRSAWRATIRWPISGCSTALTRASACAGATGEDCRLALKIRRTAGARTDPPPRDRESALGFAQVEALLGLADQPVVAGGAGIDEGSRNREVVELAEAFLKLLDGLSELLLAQRWRTGRGRSGTRSRSASS